MDDIELKNFDEAIILRRHPHIEVTNFNSVYISRLYDGEEPTSYVIESLELEELHKILPDAWFIIPPLVDRLGLIELWVTVK